MRGVALSRDTQRPCRSQLTVTVMSVVLMFMVKARSLLPMWTLQETRLSFLFLLELTQAALQPLQLVTSMQPPPAPPPSLVLPLPQVLPTQPAAHPCILSTLIAQPGLAHAPRGCTSAPVRFPALTSGVRQLPCLPACSTLVSGGSASSGICLSNREREPRCPGAWETDGEGPAESFGLVPGTVMQAGHLGLSPFFSMQIISFSGPRPRSGPSARITGLPL